MTQELKTVISAVGKGIKETTGSLISGLKKSADAGRAFNKVLGNGGKVASSFAGHIKDLISAYAGFPLCQDRCRLN